MPTANDITTPNPPPEALVRAWPRELPLIAWIAGDATGAAAQPELPGEPRPSLLALPGPGCEVGPDLAGLTDGASPPARGFGTLARLSYELGRAIEPAVRTRLDLPTLAHPLSTSPAMRWTIEAGLLREDGQGPWRALGDHPALARFAKGEHPAPSAHDAASATGCEAGPLTSESGRERYIQSVRHAVELIRAGHAFQINLAHHLTGPFSGCPRELFARLLETMRPRYAVLIDPEPCARQRRVTISCSPELFVAFDPFTREMTTRPMKGTRPAGADPDELDSSEKDNAELDMITDLMRNDLGRNASPGSVRVVRPRAIERHAGSRGVIQAISEIRATLREGATIAHAISDAFPPGSVTGAPKIRAMQIIETLEPTPRGDYCGSLLWARPDGSLESSVAIRTMTITGEADPRDPSRIIRGELRYPVGAGITSESDPESEWRETLDKARALASVGIELAERP